MVPAGDAASLERLHAKILSKARRGIPSELS